MAAESLQEYAGGRLRILVGDITELSVSVIVNAANSSLLGGGGVDGAIHRKAGKSLLEECRKIRDTAFPNGLPTGEAVLTGAGNLTAQWVIHTAGPVWSANNPDCARLLGLCYTNSLLLAGKQGCASIAFPAISTGVYGYPKIEADRIAFRAITLFLKTHDSPQNVFCVFFTKADADIFLHAIES